MMNGLPSQVNWSAPEIKQWTQSVDMYQYASEARHNMSMFLQCVWRSRYIPCQDYFTSTVTDEGFCYTFHSEEFIKANGSLKVYQTGSDYGLKIRGVIEQDEYYYGTTASAGMRVNFHMLMIVNVVVWPWYWPEGSHIGPKGRYLGHTSPLAYMETLTYLLFGSSSSSKHCLLGLTWSGHYGINNTLWILLGHYGSAIMVCVSPVI